jgi:hypothetical protein
MQFHSPARRESCAPPPASRSRVEDPRPAARRRGRGADRPSSRPGFSLPMVGPEAAAMLGDGICSVSPARARSEDGKKGWHAKPRRRKESARAIGTGGDRPRRDRRGPSQPWLCRGAATADFTVVYGLRGHSLSHCSTRMTARPAPPHREAAQRTVNSPCLRPRPACSTPLLLHRSDRIRTVFTVKSAISLCIAATVAPGPGTRPSRRGRARCQRIAKRSALCCSACAAAAAQALAQMCACSLHVFKEPPAKAGHDKASTDNGT